MEHLVVGEPLLVVAVEADDEEDEAADADREPVRVDEGLEDGDEEDAAQGAEGHDLLRVCLGKVRATG